MTETFSVYPQALCFPDLYSEYAWATWCRPVLLLSWCRSCCCRRWDYHRAAGVDVFHEFDVHVFHLLFLKRGQYCLSLHCVGRLLGTWRRAEYCILGTSPSVRPRVNVVCRPLPAVESRCAVCFRWVSSLDYFLAYSWKWISLLQPSISTIAPWRINQTTDNWNCLLPLRPNSRLYRRASQLGFNGFRGNKIKVFYRYVCILPCYVYLLLG